MDSSDGEPLDENNLLDADEAGEEIQTDPDDPMDSDLDEDGDPDSELQLQNDSSAYFDSHGDSIFSIAQHPRDPSIIATGAGDDTTFVFSTESSSALLPKSFESHPELGNKSLEPLAKLTGHRDSVNALIFTLPSGDFLLSGGLDGKLRAFNAKDHSYPFLAEVQEVPEINFLVPCPHPTHQNTVALGSSDGSVWVYTIDESDSAAPLQIVQTFFLHTASCTAGAWSPDGKMLATVSEDSSFYVWDVFGDAAAAGIQNKSGSQALVGMTAEDARFVVNGGLFSVAIAPSGAFAAIGGAGGLIRIIGLPILGGSSISSTQGLKGGVSKNKSGGGRKAGGPEGSSGGQAGQILASLQAQEDGVETLDFGVPPSTILAAGSVDGSIVLFDTAHGFAVRRHIKDAHNEFAVVKVEFASSPNGYLLTSGGLDGVVRRWDTRGTTTGAARGMVQEWKGHKGNGEGGGVLGFVQGGGKKIVTAGDDGVSLVFSTPTVS